MTTLVFEPASLGEFLLKGFPSLETSDGHQHISASSLKMFVRCPEQFRRRYILGHKAPPSGAQLWGRADHKAVEVNYEQKISTMEDLPVAEVQERFATEVEQAIAGVDEEISWDGALFKEKTESQAIALVKDRGTALVGIYQQQIAPAIFPVTIEEEFLLPLNGCPPIKGRIDLKAKRFDLFTTETQIANPFNIERKTKAQNRAPGKDDLFQSRIYELVNGLPVEFQVSVKSTSPRVSIHDPQPLEPPERTREALKRVVLSIASCASIYGDEQPWPDHGRMHDWACGFCSFQTSCPWWHPEFWPK